MHEGRLRLVRRARRSAVAVLALAGLVLSPAAPAAKAYKWVDEQGNVTYQDRPPPDSASAVEERSLDGPSAEVPEGAREQQAAAAAETSPVTLYVVPDCAACELVQAHLGRWDVPYDVKSVESDTSNQAELVGLIGRLEIPTLRIGEQVVRGYTASAIDSALAEAGYPSPEGVAPEEPAEETAASGESQ